MSRRVHLQRKVLICSAAAILVYLIDVNFHLYDNVDWLLLSNEERRSQNLRELWFMKVQPQPSGARRDIPLTPEEIPSSDRIVNQLMFVPYNYNHVNDSSKYKKILLRSEGIYSWNGESGPGFFKKSGCLVDTCTITTAIEEAPTADLVIYKDNPVSADYSRPPQQIWMFYMLESPYHSNLMPHKDVFNWTATYRRDSDIPEPYNKWVYYNTSERQNAMEQNINYAEGKTKLVAWFVSNCYDKNHRLDYAHALQKYIQVDIYGSCGPLRCPRIDKCFKMLESTYKFYLAFENSNCVHYITEKFFSNSLRHNVIPIVMGARPQDYAAVAPYHSYIHVDDFDSPKELAEYLHELDEDDELYNSYFQWKGTGELINTHFFCRVCAMLHADYPTKIYYDINEWWRAPGTCTGGSWREFNKTNAEMIKGWS